LTLPGALVVGGDYRALGIVRSLGRRGIRVWVALDEHVLAGRSRYVERRVQWPSAPGDEPARYLLRLAEEHGLDGWVLFPTADVTAEAVGRAHAMLAGRFRHTVSPWKLQQFAADKRLAYERATALGIDHPGTFHPAGRQELGTLDVRFPVILKPAIKVGHNPLSDDKAWRVDTRDDLLARYAQACAFMDPEQIMVQELIPGGGEARFSFAAVCRDGRPLAAVVARRTRQYPVDFGRASTFVETIDDPGIVEPASRLLEDLALDGLVEVEFQRDHRDGRFKLLDVNPRAWGWHSIGEAAGVDFAYLAWRTAIGDPLPALHARPGVRWARLSTDVPTAALEIAAGRMALVPYLRSLRPPLEGPIAAWDDPLPAILELPLSIGAAARRFRPGTAVPPTTTSPGSTTVGAARRRAWRPRSPRPRVCIVRQNDMYEPMIQREAEALVDAGYDVEVLCMRRPGRPRLETINGVKVTSLPSSRRKGSEVRYALDYVWFFALVTGTLAVRQLRRPYAFVQVNTMPDFLVFAAVVPKLLGSRVLAYMHEPTPELAETVLGSARIARVLAMIEQASLRFADASVTVTEQLKQRYVERGARADRITVVLNCVAPKNMLDGWSPGPVESEPAFTLVCHGTIEDRYGQDTIIEAVRLLRDDLPDLRVVLTGRGSRVPDMLAAIDRAGLGDIIRFEGWVAPERLNDLLHGADVGIVAQKASPYSHLVHTNKMVDYWIFGLPVIASRLRSVSELYDDTVIEYYQAGDPSSLARAIRRLHDDPERRAELARNGQIAHETHGWATQRATYLDVFDSLLAERG